RSVTVRTSQRARLRRACAFAPPARRPGSERLFRPAGGRPKARAAVPGSPEVDRLFELLLRRASLAARQPRDCRGIVVGGPVTGKSKAPPGAIHGAGFGRGGPRPTNPRSSSGSSAHLKPTAMPKT